MRETVVEGVARDKRRGGACRIFQSHATEKIRSADGNKVVMVEENVDEVCSRGIGRRGFPLQMEEFAAGGQFRFRRPSGENLLKRGRGECSIIKYGLS